MLVERLPCDSAPLTPFFPDAVIQCPPRLGNLPLGLPATLFP